MQTEPDEALIALGSNRPWLGLTPVDVVRRAAASLARLGPVRLSGLYDSPSWPDPSRPPYVNAVLAMRTALSAEALLSACQAVEAGFGRRRDAADRNAPRTLDLDLIGLGARQVATERLELPHPRLGERDFVLLPLAEVAPGWRHPASRETVEQMIANLPSITAVRRPA